MCFNFVRDMSPTEDKMTENPVHQPARDENGLSASSQPTGTDVKADEDKADKSSKGKVRVLEDATQFNLTHPIPIDDQTGFNCAYSVSSLSVWFCKHLGVISIGVVTTVYDTFLGSTFWKGWVQYHAISFATIECLDPFSFLCHILAFTAVKHPLWCRWSIWYDGPAKKTTLKNWSDNLKEVYTFDTVEVWRVVSVSVRKEWCPGT